MNPRGTPRNDEEGNRREFHDAPPARSDPSLRSPHSTRRARRRRRKLLSVGVLIALLASWTTFALVRSAPNARLVKVLGATQILSGQPFNVSPAFAMEEAFAIGGVGTIASSSGQIPIPIASLTKIMAALVILHDHPLTLGQSGPSIVVTPSDVAQYHLEKSRGDSVVAVRSGETLSELQALEAILIPSGDNVTQLMAQWDAGSQGAFVAQMNALAQSMGARHTTYAGTSGANPATVSTANDQLRITEIAMKNPIFAGIVAMPQVILPVAGLSYNVNADLGTHGIDGVKTGWLPQSGGCVVVAAEDRIGSSNVSILGVVLGQQGKTPIPSALRTSRHLIATIEQSLRFDYVRAGTTIANYDAINGQVIPIISTSSERLVALGGARVSIKVRLTRRISQRLAARTIVGNVTMSLGSERATSSLQTATALSGSTLWWRFTHL